MTKGGAREGAGRKRSPYSKRLHLRIRPEHLYWLKAQQGQIPAIMDRIMNEAILQDLFNKRDRLIPQTGPELVEMNITDNDWEKTSLQWHEYATLDGLPVTVYYRTTPEDQARYKTSEDSDEPEWWEERIEKIELHKDFYGLMVEAEEKEREAEELREELRKIEESYRQNG